MKHAARPADSTRWLFPVAITLLALAILRQKSPNPVLFSRYDGRILLLFLSTLIWAIACWWIALDVRRYTRLASRIQQVALPLPLGFLLVGLFLLDFLTPLIDDVVFILSRQFFLISCLSILALMLLMLLLASEQPRRAFQNLTVMLVAIGVTMILGEIVFRTLLVEHRVPQTDQAFDRLIAASWPHPVSPAKPDGSFRILGLSDSFGRAGDRQNYHYLLEDLLHQENSRYKVVNLSMSAYELPEERALFERFGSRYQPDVVLHGVFVGNDFWGDPDVTLLSYRGISLRLKHGTASWRPHNFLLRQWIKNSLILLRNAVKKQAEQAVQTAGEMSRSEFLRVERKRLDICHKALSPDDEIWIRAASLLDQIREEAAQAGATYVMVMHPDQFQVELALLQKIGRMYALDPDDYDLEQPQRFLRTYCESRAIPCLDLLPVFRRHGMQGGLYLANDTHYNEQGNRLAAEEILDFLQANRLLMQKGSPAPAQ
ncbi:hypothetical protein GF339_03045 [candidate division KSB3 bacterium]|uniref:AlgX/AlgJ SGNH hydrolase-like domain-containing protein n=1 Tax=candidate division KSB3 bacterium TaxID=2044937 RepID=A0A9D5Q4T8_9BACT|nr:hypothetical protein [candidate division KSB3 bacterium]MBD3323532.1 hypothetical protein [candidate division KSB3 bacterium]